MPTDARNLTLSLGGIWRGHYGTAPCPLCQPERRRDQNALTLANGADSRLLADCKKSGCAFTDILAAAGIAAGDYTSRDPETIAQREAARRAEANRKARQARRVWDEAQPVRDTLAESYLRGRGITCPLPKSLRFHPECWHGPTASRHPALVARIDGAEGFAVHRTYLRHDGTGKAPVEPAKAMLGCTRGGAVRLSRAGDTLVVGEGIESTLSLLSGVLCGPATLWAALSTSGMSALTLPPDPGNLIVATDRDDSGAGNAAGNALAERASALGWTVSLLPAPWGHDWNDVVMKRGAA